MELPSGGETAEAAPSRVRHVIGAVVLVAGAVLAVAGSLMPVFEQVIMFTAERETYSMTLWGIESTMDFAPSEDEQTHFGVPVVVAAALLAVVAALVLAAPRLPSRFAAPTSIGAVAVAALLIGSVWTVGQLVLLAVSDQGTKAVQGDVGPGTWVLVLACGAALAGGLLVQDWPEHGTSALLPEPEPGGAVVYRLPDEDDTDTPPQGIPFPEDTRGGGA